MLALVYLLFSIAVWMIASPFRNVNSLITILHFYFGVLTATTADSRIQQSNKERRLYVAVKERVTVSGRNLVEKVKELVHQGNIRRVRLIHEEKTLIDIPLSVGAPAAAVVVLAVPVLAAIGAIAALVKECTLEIEKVEDTGENKN